MNKKDFLLLLISTFIIVLAWIIFNVYHSSVKSTIPEKLSIQIVNIDPNFDVETLEKLKKRKKVVPVFEFQEEATASSEELKTENLEISEKENLQ